MEAKYYTNDYGYFFKVENYKGFIWNRDKGWVPSEGALDAVLDYTHYDRIPDAQVVEFAKKKGAKL